MSSPNAVRVLIVDDSAVARRMLMELLSTDPLIEVVGTASDPYMAVRQIEKLAPEVIVLDVEMPRMDGLTFLERLMAQHPMPVVMCSSLTTEGSKTAIQALEMGAVDVFAKPKLESPRILQEVQTTFCDIIKSAAKARLRRRPRELSRPMPEHAFHVPPKLSPDVIIPGPSSRQEFEVTDPIIVVGASTGGTEALRIFLQEMPTDCPGILCVQHMPENFTRTFAQRLDSLCRISVREASNGDEVKAGQALIAPGNRHMLLKRLGGKYCVELHDGPLVSRHRPAVNVLFRSAARYAGPNAIAVIMTGMGDDGAIGMAELAQQGALTLAQDEATCVVYGMPGEAVRLGGVQHILPLDQLATACLKHSRRRA